MQEQLTAAAPHAEAIVATATGRRRATAAHRHERFEHIPPELLAHQMLGAAACQAVEPLVEYALRRRLAARGRAHHLPGARRVGHRRPAAPVAGGAARFRDDWLPHADWLELDGVGHCPQLDVPLETAQLIVDFTTR